MTRETKIARWFSFESGLEVRVDLFRKETRACVTTMWSAIPKVDGVEREATVGASLREVLKNTRVVVAKQRSEKFKKVNERLLAKDDDQVVYSLAENKKIHSARIFSGGRELQEGQDYRIDGSKILMHRDVPRNSFHVTHVTASEV